jgi:hypothetical protein
MENTRKITNILTLTVVFCLVLGQVAQAEEKAKLLLGSGPGSTGRGESQIFEVDRA